MGDKYNLIYIYILSSLKMQNFMWLHPYIYIEKLLSLTSNQIKAFLC